MTLSTPFFSMLFLDELLIYSTNSTAAKMSAYKDTCLLICYIGRLCPAQKPLKGPDWLAPQSSGLLTCEGGLLVFNVQCSGLAQKSSALEGLGGTWAIVTLQHNPRVGFQSSSLRHHLLSLPSQSGQWICEHSNIKYTSEVVF